MADLKAATFSNDNGEWLARVVLALQANEPPALLLCCFDETNIDGASTEEDEHGNQIIRPVTPWYAAYISRLLQITSFDIENPAISPTSALENYRLYAITDIDAYHNICARNSIDWDITITTFAGDCDIVKLQKLITQYKGYHSTPTEEILPLSGWTYWSEYGGGSDEHLGLFYAKDARLTDAFWQRLATGQRNAFFAPLYSITFYDSDQEICSLPFMVAEALRQEPPLLLCRFDGRLAYSQWDAENWEYRPDTCWYAEDLNKLSLVAKFNHGHFEYQVFKVTDSNACLRLWSEKWALRSPKHCLRLIVTSSSLSSAWQILRSTTCPSSLPNLRLGPIPAPSLWGVIIGTFMPKQTTHFRLFKLYTKRCSKIPSAPQTSAGISFYVATNVY